MYIDPPYNTESSKKDGNDYKDDSESKPSKFIYRDKFSRDGWLNMMNERLKLAKQLLSQEGLIFISIDDNEQAYLKVLMDEIFGEDNFVENFIWYKGEHKGLSKTTSNIHEYILCYAKNKDVIQHLKYFKMNKIGYEEMNDFLEKLNHKYLNNNVNYESSLKNATKEFKEHLRSNKNLFSGVLNFNNLEIDYETNKFVVFSKGDVGSPKRENSYQIKTFDVLHPVTKKPVRFPENGWRFTEETMQEHIKKGNLIFGVDETTSPNFKRYLNKFNDVTQDSVLKFKSSGSDTLKKILTPENSKSENLFPYPKPVALIKNLIKLINRKDITVLDFFAGSGTTGQAVMELNQEDGGNRKFILVTNNQNNIGEEITRERLYRIIKGKGSNGETIKWEFDKQTKYLENNLVNVFEVKTSKLTVNDFDRARDLKIKAKENFAILNPEWRKKNISNIYYELSSLSPYKDENEGNK
ncbi:site-specific DNA-methyltransferase [Mycoplasmopsis agassizii]|nr:site-specific DNA-methyltransferase [Mycoplasmopsis agassizii]